MFYSKLRHIEKLVFSVLAHLETFRNSLCLTDMNARLHRDDEINKALREIFPMGTQTCSLSGQRK